MRKTELTRFRKMLMEEKERVTSSLAKHEKIIKHTNDQSGLETGKAHSNHMADQGSDEFQYETTIKFANTEGRYLYNIEEALAELKEKYHYICVSRKRIDPPAGDNLITIKQTKRMKVEAELMKHDGEVYLYCRSKGRQAKEKGIQSRLKQRFEEKLEVISAAIHKKGGMKKYRKVVERIGRAKEKYKQIAQYYDIRVEERKGVATEVSWEYRKEESDQRFSGSYFLRTDREDLTEKEIWGIYTMLLDLEDAFRTMKTELALRPNFHHKERRSDGHIFITLLAYHVVHSIRTHLKEKGIRHCWTTIRDRLCKHERVTNGMNTEDGRRLYIRQCSEPELFPKMIYKALGLEPPPRGRRIFTI